MSRRCNKQNSISSLINKKPEKCLYEKQSIRKESSQAATYKDSRNL